MQQALYRFHQTLAYTLFPSSLFRLWCLYGTATACTGPWGPVLTLHSAQWTMFCICFMHPSKVTYIWPWNFTEWTQKTPQAYLWWCIRQIIGSLSIDCPAEVVMVDYKRSFCLLIGTGRDLATTLCSSCMNSRKLSADCCSFYPLVLLASAALITVHFCCMPHLVEERSGAPETWKGN
jgi:hypothetical protein